MRTSLDSHIHLFRPGEAGDPLTLLMLHGSGGDEASFAELGPTLAPGAVLSVRGNVDEHGMSRFFSASQRRSTIWRTWHSARGLSTRARTR